VLSLPAQASVKRNSLSADECAFLNRMSSLNEEETEKLTTEENRRDASRFARDLMVQEVGFPVPSLVLDFRA
jgi:hypothetical protein